MAPCPSLMAGALCVLAVSTLVAFGMHTGDQDKPELHAASALEKQDAVAGAEPPAPKEKKHHLLSKEETEKEHHAEEASQKMQKHHEEALAKRAAAPKTEQKVEALKKKEEKEEKKDAVFVLTKKGAAGYNRNFGGSVKAGDTLAEEHLETAGMSMEDAVRGGLAQAKEEDEASSNPSLVEEKEEDQEAWGFGGKTTPKPMVQALPQQDTRDDAVDDLDKSALDQGVAVEKDGKIPPGMATSGCEGENKTCCNAEACGAGTVLKPGVEEGATATPCKQAQCTPGNDQHTCCESKDRANKRESKATSTTPGPEKSLDKTNKGKR